MGLKIILFSEGHDSQYKNNGQPEKNVVDESFALRYRPQVATELIGQKEIWAPGTPLWELVHRDRFHGLILWGPPGSGKTSMGRLIGTIVGREVNELSAVEAGVKDIRGVIEASREAIQHGGKAMILFLDEIHRLNKNQQDSLLKALEDGSIRLIGATTENPSFSVNNALLSRCLTFAFAKIDGADLASHLRKVASHEGKNLSSQVSELLAQAADGDGRAALNLLESVLAVVSEGKNIDEAAVRPFLSKIASHYDRSGDFHYDLISAFIKSIRATDPNGAVYYLARMLQGGEDPLFIARRLVIAASEDIGNAHPTALVIAQTGLNAVKEIGMPEARIILSQVTTYLASSPKSNRSYVAINEALEVVKETGDLPVPLHLRNAPTAFLRSQGYGQGYVYAHDNPKKASQMSSLPESLQGREFYRPSEAGSEKAIGAFLRKLREKSP